MSISLFSGLLIHTAVIFRRQQVEGSYKKDRFGQPTRDELESHMSACRITSARGKEEFTDRTHDVVVATHKIFLPPGTEVSEEDVITVLEAPVAIVAAAADKDPEDYAKGFHAVVDRAEVLLARRNPDAVSEHHREVSVSTQRQAAAAH